MYESVRLANQPDRPLAPTRSTRFRTFHHRLAPLVDLATGAAVGAEVGGVTAGWWLDAGSLLAEASMRTPPGGTIHVDVAASDLQRPALLSSIARLPGSVRERLVLEVTDREPIGLRTVVESPIAVLRQLGVRFAVDEFGVGWANLAMVDIIRPDLLKVSRTQLIHDRRVARWIVGLVRSLDATAVVEAIDTPEDLAWAHDIGFTVGQGQLWSRTARSRTGPGAATAHGSEPPAPGR